MSKQVLDGLRKANADRHLLSLLRKHSLTGVQKVLVQETGTAPSLPSLSTIAKEAGIVVRGRGRPTVYSGKVKDQILALIREHGSHKIAREVLASQGLPCPTSATMVKYAQAAGIVVKHGRPSIVKEAA